jgi:hypothetical protein
MSTAALVRERVDSTPSRGFVAVRDVPGPRRAVESAFSRMAADGDLVHVRRGLYWKGPHTRLGMPRPRGSELGLALAGPGGGPAGVTAARALGLTTQVPSVDTYAVAGRPRSAPVGVRFVSRSIERRIHHLAPIEVALLEVLRDWPGTSESTWAGLVATVRAMSESDLRIEVLRDHVESEVHVGLRERWLSLVTEL